MLLLGTTFCGIKGAISCDSVWRNRSTPITFLKEVYRQVALWLQSYRGGGEEAECYSGDEASTQITASSNDNRQLEACSKM
jgi:hypothetical protein